MFYGRVSCSHLEKKNNFAHPSSSKAQLKLERLCTNEKNWQILRKEQEQLPWPRTSSDDLRSMHFWLQVWHTMPVALTTQLHVPRGTTVQSERMGFSRQISCPSTEVSVPLDQVLARFGSTSIYTTFPSQVLHRRDHLVWTSHEISASLQWSRWEASAVQLWRTGCTCRERGPLHTLKAQRAPIASMMGPNANVPNPLPATRNENKFLLIIVTLSQIQNRMNANNLRVRFTLVWPSKSQVNPVLSTMEGKDSENPRPVRCKTCLSYFCAFVSCSHFCVPWICGPRLLHSTFILRKRVARLNKNSFGTTNHIFVHKFALTSSSKQLYKKRGFLPKPKCVALIIACSVACMAGGVMELQWTHTAVTPRLNTTLLTSMKGTSHHGLVMKLVPRYLSA